MFVVSLLQLGRSLWFVDSSEVGFRRGGRSLVGEHWTLSEMFDVGETSS